MKKIFLSVGLLLIVSVLLGGCSTHLRNRAPVADAGNDRQVNLNATVTLDGSDSVDEDGDKLTYKWEMLSTPSGSKAALSSTTDVKPTFVIDVRGDYTLQLVVNDGTEDSDADEVLITTETLPTRQGMIINHLCTDIDQIPVTWINRAKKDLYIAYEHTSHGSQLITGMDELDEFMGGEGVYVFNDAGSGDALRLDDQFAGGTDLGDSSWADDTESYLKAHPDCNVVMWSWCGQVSDASEAVIDTYLSRMSGLEKEYPDVSFVYMTGHTDGTGLSGDLHIRNQQIRNYCSANNKILYDFEDIESYDPDGKYFGDKSVDDGCNYDPSGNWATEYQNSHKKGVDWYDCSSAHSQPVNANMKAYAAWWLFARIAGWDGESS
jgi:hypothetical protein